MERFNDKKYLEALDTRKFGRRLIHLPVTGSTNDYAAELISNTEVSGLEDIDGTLVVLGSHDNTIDLLATMLRRRDHRLRLSSGHVGSLGGLMALRQGRAHLGGSHMLDPETNTYNVPFIKRYLAEVPLKLVNLAWREQGLMVSPGNPKEIRSIRDLIRPGVRFINRQRGAGTRLLLDYLLQEEGLDAAHVDGYTREEYTHMAVAVNVASGTADVGLGIMAAAKALGIGNFRIIFRHMMPNAVAPVLVSATIGIASAILTEAGLSFLGFGVPPPHATWGNILSNGKNFIFDAPWLTFIPGITILIVVLSFNLFGEGLRDVLNPKLRERH